MSGIGELCVDGGVVTKPVLGECAVGEFAGCVGIGEL